MDTHAQYYFQRKKMNAALQYMQRAMDQITRIKSAEGKVSLQNGLVILQRVNIWSQVSGDGRAKEPRGQMCARTE